MNTDQMTTADIMSQVVVEVISSTLTVETTLAKCPELKRHLLETMIFKEYLAWHNDHLSDVGNPTIFLYDLTLWTQERARHHIASSTTSRMIN